jgi:hypothetical protein
MTERSNLIDEDVSAADKKKIDDLLDQLERLVPLHFLSTEEKAALAKPSDEQLAALQPLFELAAKNKPLFDTIYNADETQADLNTNALINHLHARIAHIAEGLLGTRLLVRSDLARTGENIYDMSQRFADRLKPGSDAAIEPARKFYGRRARRRAP